MNSESDSDDFEDEMIDASYLEGIILKVYFLICGECGLYFKNHAPYDPRNLILFFFWVKISLLLGLKMKKLGKIIK